MFDNKPVDAAWLEQTGAEALASQRELISIVGITAIMLPPLLLVVDFQFGHSCVRDSLSHYYYGRGTGDIFVMALAFIGALLIAYRGETKSISLLAVLAGVMAILVGLVPTTASGCADGVFDGRAFVDVAQGTASLSATPFALFPGVGNLHFSAAVGLFAIMFLFTFIIFRLVGPSDIHPTTGQILGIKRIRNGIYLGCAILTVIALAAIVLHSIFDFAFADDINLVLIAEWVALWAMGFAWLVKGRVFNLRVMGA